jgi:23S rRNA pseudouridine1911/1915/1917 synthase
LLFPETISHTVPDKISPIRLSDYGIGLFEVCMTKSALKKVLKKGWIKVNGVTAKTATMITGGEEIVLTKPEEPKPERQFIFPLDVLYEDDYLAVIHKPAGILVSGNGFKTIVNALPQNLQRSPLPDATAPQPVHRLDYATTGVLLIGKTSSSIRQLNRLFQEKQVHKVYYAVTIGSMGPLGSICYSIDNKPAQTDFEVLDRVPSPRFGELNLVRLKPGTGRRHQIRKHLARIGNPILGDKDYGKEDLILNGKGLYLHASSLSFEHPRSKEQLIVKSELPKRFGKIFPGINIDRVDD